MAGGVQPVASIDLDLQGLVDGLKRAEPLIEKNLHSALKMVGTMVANRAKEHHEYNDRTGTLTQSIRGAEPTGKFLEGKMSVDVKAGGARVKYALAIEDGAQPHVIKARKKKALSFGDGIVVRSVKHPGNKAYKFMANAVDHVMEGNRVENILESALASAIERGMEKA